MSKTNKQDVKKILKEFFTAKETDISSARVKEFTQFCGEHVVPWVRSVMDQLIWDGVNNHMYIFKTMARDANKHAADLEISLASMPMCCLHTRAISPNSYAPSRIDYDDTEWSDGEKEALKHSIWGRNYYATEMISSTLDCQAQIQKISFFDMIRDLLSNDFAKMRALFYLFMTLMENDETPEYGTLLHGMTSDQQCFHEDTKQLILALLDVLAAHGFSRRFQDKASEERYREGWLLMHCPNLKKSVLDRGLARLEKLLSATNDDGLCKYPNISDLILKNKKYSRSRLTLRAVYNVCDKYVFFYYLSYGPVAVDLVSGCYFWSKGSTAVAATEAIAEILGRKIPSKGMQYFKLKYAQIFELLVSFYFQVMKRKGIQIEWIRDNLEKYFSTEIMEIVTHQITLMIIATLMVIMILTREPKFKTDRRLVIYGLPSLAIASYYIPHVGMKLMGQYMQLEGFLNNNQSFTYVLTHDAFSLKTHTVRFLNKWGQRILEAFFFITVARIENRLNRSDDGIMSRVIDTIDEIVSPSVEYIQDNLANSVLTNKKALTYEDVNEAKTYKEHELLKEVTKHLNGNVEPNVICVDGENRNLSRKISELNVDLVIRSLNESDILMENFRKSPQSLQEVYFNDIEVGEFRDSNKIVQMLTYEMPIMDYNRDFNENNFELGFSRFVNTPNHTLHHWDALQTFTAKMLQKNIIMPDRFFHSINSQLMFRGIIFTPLTTALKNIGMHLTVAISDQLFRPMIYVKKKDVEIRHANFLEFVDTKGDVAAPTTQPKNITDMIESEAPFNSKKVIDLSNVTGVAEHNNNRIAGAELVQNTLLMGKVIENIQKLLDAINISNEFNTVQDKAAIKAYLNHDFKLDHATAFHAAQILRVFNPNKKLGVEASQLIDFLSWNILQHEEKFHDYNEKTWLKHIYYFQSINPPCNIVQILNSISFENDWNKMSEVVVPALKSIKELTYLNYSAATEIMSEFFKDKYKKADNSWDNNELRTIFIMNNIRRFPNIFAPRASIFFPDSPAGKLFYKTGYNFNIYQYHSRIFQTARENLHDSLPCISHKHFRELSIAISSLKDNELPKETMIAMYKANDDVVVGTFIFYIFEYINYFVDQRDHVVDNPIYQSIKTNLCSLLEQCVHVLKIDVFEMEKIWAFIIDYLFIYNIEHNGRDNDVYVSRALYISFYNAVISVKDFYESFTLSKLYDITSASPAPLYTGDFSIASI